MTGLRKRRLGSEGKWSDHSELDAMGPLERDEFVEEKVRGGEARAAPGSFRGTPATRGKGNSTEDTGRRKHREGRGGRDAGGQSAGSWLLGADHDLSTLPPEVPRAGVRRWADSEPFLKTGKALLSDPAQGRAECPAARPCLWCPAVRLPLRALKSPGHCHSRLT